MNEGLRSTVRLNNKRILAGVCGCLLLSGACDPARDAMLAKGADDYARETIEVVRTKGISGLRPMLDPKTAAMPGVDAAIARMRQALPSSEPDSIVLVDGDISTESGVTTSKLAYRVYGRNSTARADVWLVLRDGRQYVETLRIEQVAGSPTKITP